MMLPHILRQLSASVVSRYPKVSPGSHRSGLAAKPLIWARPSLPLLLTAVERCNDSPGLALHLSRIGCRFSTCVPRAQVSLHGCRKILLADEPALAQLHAQQLAG